MKIKEIEKKKLRKIKNQEWEAEKRKHRGLPSLPPDSKPAKAATRKRPVKIKVLGEKAYNKYLERLRKQDELFYRQ